MENCIAYVELCLENFAPMIEAF